MKLNILIFVTLLQLQTALCAHSGKSKDTEPPRFTVCPKDTTKVTSEAYTRVNWELPVAVDNSGVPPRIDSSRQSGDMFGVGEFNIIIRAWDQSGNEATPCKFKVIVKKKPCDIPPPPKNGVVTCYEHHQGEFGCAISCQKPYDFARNPAAFYFCGYGKWWNIALPSQEVFLPFPNCITRDKPSKLLKDWPNFYQYSGSASDSVVRSKIKDSFLKFIKTSQLVPPILCNPPAKPCDPKKAKVFY